MEYEELARYRSLIAAVVAQGITDWRAARALCQGGKGYSREPERWLRSQAETPFSFRWCCVQLDIAPDSVLRRIGL